MDESEIIYNLLVRLRERDFFAIPSLQSAEEKKAAYKMQALKLIVPRGNTYDIGELGYEVLDARSFDIWSEERRRRERDIHQATIVSAEATVDAATQAKGSKYAAWFAGIVALITFALGVWQFVQSNEQEGKINTLSRKVEKLTNELDSIRSSSARLNPPKLNP